MPRFLNTYWVEFFTLRMKALLAACKPLILLDFHRSFNDTRTMSSDEILTVKETAVLLKTTRQQVRKMIANEELPACWSVGCLTHKSESFRLQFALFTAVRSAGFPLFPPSPARFFRILGQNWVKGCNIRRDWQLQPCATVHTIYPHTTNGVKASVSWVYLSITAVASASVTERKSSLLT